MAITQLNSWISVSTPLPKDKLVLRAFRGEESISAPFHFTLDCISLDKMIALTALSGKVATITMNLGDKSKRYINGVISRCAWTGNDDRFSFYQLELRPFYWLLSMAVDNRIFQNKSVKQIVETIFKDHGFKDFKFQLKGAPKPLEYVVQYQESSFDFINRLLEDEGIFYFFEHTASKHTMVFADDNDVYKKVAGVSGACKVGQTIMKSEFIQEAKWEAMVQPNAYSLTDYNFETPTTDLFVKAKSAHTFKSAAAAKMMIYDHPSTLLKKADGEKRLKVRVEAIEHKLRTLRGKGCYRGFAAGHKFKLADHPRTGRNNIEYALRWVCHSADWKSYSNAFEAFPMSLPFRPPMITKRPEVCGCSAIAVATVVGKAGEEIWTDKYGRIKIQFPWDREGKKNETSSCWVRVTQSVAGKNFGTWFLPRIGQEVLVNFIGMVPIVVGALYNAKNPVPYALPANQSKSTIKTNSTKGGGGFNELRFDDKKGAEEIYIHAQKDQNVKIHNNLHEDVGVNQQVHVGANQTVIVGGVMNESAPQRIQTHHNRDVKIHEIKVKVLNGYTKDGKAKWKTKTVPGLDKLVITKGNRIIELQKGDETHKVVGKRDVKVKAAETHTNDDDFTHKVKGNYTLKVTGNLSITVTGDLKIKAKNVIVESQMDTKIKAGMNLKAKAGMNMDLEAGMNLKAKGGLMLDAQGGVAAKVKGGAMAALEAGAMATVKGAIVKIG